MKILVTGSSGLVGSRLVPFLEGKGHSVVKLVRKQYDLQPNEIGWDPAKGVVNPSLLEGLEAVIHLAGENISTGRWNKERKKTILTSRELGTLILCRALSSLEDPPKVLICASAIGYYGNRGDEVLTEESSPGEGFLADVCGRWEKATEPALKKGIRVVNLRLGVVLSPEGGALKKMLTPFKLGLGGVLGSGKQYVSWIALDDLLKMIQDILCKDSLSGPVNAVSPTPVTNGELTKTLGEILHRPTFMWVPEFAVRLAFGEMGDELLLNSDRVIPKKMMDAGFEFSYPSLKDALKHLLSSA
jgi:uncharacterized protein (TIGR01777 family)